MKLGVYTKYSTDPATGINFRTNMQVSDIIVKYDEIIGYDSTRYAFLIEELAWERIAKEVKPAYPASESILFIALNNELIYKAGFMPPYYDVLRYDIFTSEMISFSSATSCFPSLSRGFHPPLKYCE